MKTKNIGFLLTHIDNSITYNKLFEEISILIQKHPYHHICIFNSHCEKMNTMNIPLLHINQAKFFDGKLFVFDIPGLYLVKHFHLIKQKYFLAQDIPWIKTQDAYAKWKNILMQNNLEVIASNQYVNDIYSICWKKPISIMESISNENISQLL